MLHLFTDQTRDLLLNLVTEMSYKIIHSAYALSTLAVSLQSMRSTFVPKETSRETKKNRIYDYYNRKELRKHKKLR